METQDLDTAVESEVAVVEGGEGQSTQTPHEEDRETLREALSKNYDSAVEDAVVTREPGTPVAKPEAKPEATAPTQSELDEQAILNEARPIPERLKTKLAATWATLDPAIRAEFHNYESHVGALANKFGKAAKSWEDLSAVTAPYEQMIRTEGGTLQSAVGSLLQTAHILRNGTVEQKQALVDRMCEVYKVPPRRPAEAGSEILPQIPPELDARLTALERERLTARAEEQQNLEHRINTDLETFLADPKNIYVKEPGYLRTMSGLIQAGRAQDLADAYKQAAWLHDGPRAVEIAKINAERVQSQSARVIKAKRGAGVNGNAPGAVRLDPSKLTLRQTLDAAYEGELDS